VVGRMPCVVRYLCACNLVLGALVTCAGEFGTCLCAGGIQLSAAQPPLDPQDSAAAITSHLERKLSNIHRLQPTSRRILVELPSQCIQYVCVQPCAMC
jgi:hypothetical protein